LINVWRVLFTKGDAEPWWFFENWEQDIIKTQTFSMREEAIAYFNEEVSSHQRAYPEFKQKKGSLAAFWDPEEKEYCDPCDDFVQVYYGILLMENDIPMELLL
jgi:hypothetical protein